MVTGGPGFSVLLGGGEGGRDTPKLHDGGRGLVVSCAQGAVGSRGSALMPPGEGCALKMLS